MNERSCALIDDETLIDISIQKLIVWCKKRGFEVSFTYSGYDYMDWDEKLIHINSRQRKEHQLYSFLHEIGHLLIIATGRYHEYHPVQAKSEESYRNSRLKRSKKYKVDVVAEEIDAWKRGKKTAKRLNLFLNEENYIKYSAEKVYSYIEWAADRER